MNFYELMRRSNNNNNKNVKNSGAFILLCWMVGICGCWIKTMHIHSYSYMNVDFEVCDCC